MVGRLRARLTYANVMATVAVFMALGGGAYAAVAIPANSIGSKQIKNNAVTTKKIARNAVTTANVKDGSLLKADFAAGQLPTGGTGPAGPAGPKGDTGAAGAPGSTGPPGPFIDTLPSGKTLKGEWSIVDKAAAANDQAGGPSVSFVIPLASRPTKHYIAPGGPTPTGCLGDATNPGASPGHLCVFAVEQINTGAPLICSWEESECYGTQASRFGFGIAASATAPGTIETDGSWAVTAP
jgi:hypothetical protein